MTTIEREWEESRVVKRREVIALECDVCHRQFNTEDWGAKGFEVIETEISYTTGTRYEDGCHTQTKTLDICPSYIEDIFQYLKEKGATIRIKYLGY